MTVSQRFGRFTIPFTVPLLFGLRMARVTAAETSSRERKLCPCMGSFNLWNKSKSGGVYVYLTRFEVTGMRFRFHFVSVASRIMQTFVYIARINTACFQ
jgi:hypothetical protein